MVTDLLVSISDTAQAELLDVGRERGYVLRSELEALFDPTVHADGATADLEEELHDLGIELVDDVGDDGHDATAPGSGPRPSGADAGGLVSDPVAAYLARAAQHELLDAAQEMDLAKRYQAGMAARACLEAACDEGDEGRQQRLRTLVRDGERAFDALINANLRLVVPTAKKFAGSDLPLLEAIQEGNLGLIRAVQKFDPTKGYKFSTYAVWWIRQAVQRGLSSGGRTIRAPARVWEQAGRLRRAEATLRDRLQREPDDHELAKELDMPTDKVTDIRIALRPVASLDLPVGEDGDRTLGSLLADPDAPDPQATTEAADLRARLIEALRALPERERAILELRFGLRDGQPRQLAEIGRIVDLSRERVRQLERQALAALRDSDLKDFEAFDDALVA